MTSAVVLTLSASGGVEGVWTARVRAALRPQYAADRLVVDAADPTYSSGPCRVPACERLSRGQGLCAGHLHRWVKTGRPEVNEFAASTDPGWARQRPNQACRIEACRYGVARKGLCQLHGQRWERCGRPDFDEWLAGGQPPVKTPVADACQVPGCLLWPQAAGPFCHAHHGTWRANGRPDPVVFAREFAAVRVPADQVIDLTRLPEPLRWELAYVIQCRHCRQRLGGRVPARGVAAAPARASRQPHPRLHPDRATVAAGAGQALDPAAAGHRCRARGRPPRPDRADPARRLPAAGPDR